MSRDLVLFSGGIDSAVCLGMAINPMALLVNYGQHHRIELEYAATFVRAHAIPFAWTSLDHISRAPDGMTYPGRNAALLGVAVSCALANDCDRIVIGCNADDAARFPDCRASFVRNMDRAFHKAYGVAVWAPLLESSKAQVLRLAALQGLDLAETWSCYDPTGGQPCGACLACRMRAQ